MSEEEISFVVLSEHGDPLIAHVLLRTRNGSERSPRQERFSDELGRVAFPLPEGHDVDEIVVGATVPGFWVARIEKAEPFDGLSNAFFARFISRRRHNEHPHLRHCLERGRDVNILTRLPPSW